jgi:catalase
VAGERGSPDTWRDPRGFALKFYTSEGNYDMVGNNTPVFFLRDPLKFQHFIRSQKRRADSDLRDHDMQWDFWTLSPESAHQVTMLMGDRGIPKSWRHMNGYSSHTYMWVNANGERFWVKYHFKTDQGIEFLTQEDADRIAGEDGDYHRRDLFEAIGARRLPQLDAQGADHALRGSQDLPLQPLRPHQGVAPRRLPAARGRPADAGPQPHGLPRRD